MHPFTEYLLGLTDTPYDNYNAILPKIKDLLEEPDRIEAFEQVLKEELPLTTLRCAVRTAIKCAMGEPDVYREWRPAEILAKKFSNR